MMNWNTVLRSSTLSPTLNSIYNARTHFVYCDVGVAASIAKRRSFVKVHSRTITRFTGN